MHTLRIALIVLPILWTSSSCARAQCDLFSWCPFGCHACKTDPVAAVTQVADHGSHRQSPAMLTKVGSGTKRFFSGTMNLLSFKTPAKRSTTAAGYSPQSSHKKPGFFYRLFHPEPPPPPKTIEEWMSLEQIHP